MYERTSFPANGKWARHAIRLANVSAIPVDASLQALASSRSYDTADVPTAFKFSRKEYDTLQYVLDWNCRCVVLDTKAISLSKHVAIMGAVLTGSKRIAIFAREYERVGYWIKIIQEAFPDDVIITQKNRETHRKPISTNADIETAERVWIIDRFNAISDVNLITEYKVDHVIFQKDNADIPYTTTEPFQGICKEITKTTIVAETMDFWHDLADYRSQGSLGLLTSLIADYLQTNTVMARVPQMFGTIPKVAMYFRSRGRKYQAIGLLEACGACFDLVIDKNTADFKNLVSNSMLTDDGEHSNRRAEIIKRYDALQHRVERDMGKPISGIVDEALNGNKKARNCIDQLKTQEWAKLKAQMFYSTIRSSKIENEKFLIICKNESIRKYLMLSLNAIDLDNNPTQQEQHKKFANFVYPGDYKDFSELPMGFNPRISNYVIASDLSALPQSVIERADQVYLTEFPYDAGMITDLIELAHVFKFKLVFGTMRGTFEEKLSEKLLDVLV